MTVYSRLIPFIFRLLVSNKERIREVRRCYCIDESAIDGFYYKDDIEKHLCCKMLPGKQTGISCSPQVTFASSQQNPCLASGIQLAPKYENMAEISILLPYRIKNCKDTIRLLTIAVKSSRRIAFLPRWFASFHTLVNLNSGSLNLMFQNAELYHLLGSLNKLLSESHSLLVGTNINFPKFCDKKCIAFSTNCIRVLGATPKYG
jgi:hypothetical protein